MLKLLSVTKQALYDAISVVQVGRHIGDIGATVQDLCESHGYGIVRELTGHGIGREMHEDPSVPNYGHAGSGVMLKSGMCIAIEPMVTLGDRSVGMMPDKWTIRTLDGKCAAHYEHTIAVTARGADILSTFDYIEKTEDK